jgi:seryl-tRNA synthetase
VGTLARSEKTGKADVFDIKWIRDNPEKFDAKLAARGLAAQSAELIALDGRRRSIVTDLQAAQSLRNARSRVYGTAKAEGQPLDDLTSELAESKATIERLESEQRDVDDELRQALEVIPNLPLDDVPLGKDEKDNVEVRRVDAPLKLTSINKPLQHFEIGERLGLMDFATAAKISGARFVVLKGALARLERALGAFMLDLHTSSYKTNVKRLVGEKEVEAEIELGGYSENIVPLLVKDHAAYGTGNLPKFEADLFSTSKSLQLADFFQKKMEAYGASKFTDLNQERLAELALEAFENLPWKAERFWLIPTAEVSLTNFVREEILDEAKLPMRLTAHTPCFRSEAGAAGKDTRGMIRQHQFSKVELVSVTTPEESVAEHERMTACAEEVLKRLGLPFRTILLCTGDMGFASQKTYDIEVWLPGENTYREISSCSVCGDFQARRMNARYKPKGAKDTRFVHTLNGSGLAVGRTLIAVLENYQQADGSVAIPEALRPYMGGLAKIEKAA